MPRDMAGFGLLEAIVALTIFAGAGMGLFGWINANLERAATLQAREAETRALSLALAWVESIDPAKQGAGHLELGAESRIDWQSRLLSPRQSVAPLPGGTHSPFEMAMFEVELTVRAPGLPAPRQWTLRRLGLWRQPLTMESQ
jgi:hypothetical protein